MECRGCGNLEAWRIRSYGDGTEFCNSCGGLGALSVPDVYFPGPYWDPHLAHPDRPEEAAKGVFVESKQHKLALMREQNLREAGDKKHGARIFDAALALRAKEEGLG